MLIPYGSDQDDGFVGYTSIAIVLLCILAFGLTWPRECSVADSVTNDSLKLWMQEERSAQDCLFRHQMAPDPFQTSQDRSGARAFEDSLATTNFDSAFAANLKNPPKRALEERVKSAMNKLSPLRAWGLHPGDASWFPALITHMFLHAGWGHLIGNMIFFFAFGVAMERRFGIKGFLFLYLFGGFFAALCEVGASAALHHSMPTTPLVGASGAIAATMGAFLRSYPKSKIKVFLWYIRPRFGKIPAWVFLGSWFVIQFVYNHFLSPLEEGGTAYAAHVGGFFFGFLCAQFLPVDPEVIEREKEKKRGSPILPGFPISGFEPQKKQDKSDLDKAWNCLRVGDETGAKPCFTRQFSYWIKGSDDDITKLVTELERIFRLHPQFRFDSLPMWEWGMKLAETAHTAVAIELLRMSLVAQPRLSPGLSLRGEQALARLEQHRPRPIPTPPHPPSPHATPTQPMPRPSTRLPPKKDDRPDWLVD